MIIGYWICWVLLSVLFFPLIFRCHKKLKIAARDTFINIYIYLCVYLTFLPPFGFDNEIVYALVVGVSLMILLVNCLLNRMNKSMLVVCMMLLIVMSATTRILYPQARKNTNMKKEQTSSLDNARDSQKHLETKRLR